MASDSKVKKRIIMFVLLCIILLISMVFIGLLYEKVESLKQEYETLSEKIKNNDSNMSQLSEKDIQNLFDGIEVKNEN